MGTSVDSKTGKEDQDGEEYHIDNDILVTSGLSGIDIVWLWPSG